MRGHLGAAWLALGLVALVATPVLAHADVDHVEVKAPHADAWSTGVSIAEDRGTDGLGAEGPIAEGLSAKSSAADGWVTTRIVLNGRILGVRVAKADLYVSARSDAWRARAVFRTTGLAGFVAQSRLEAQASGPRATDVRSADYGHVEEIRDKVRTVTLTRAAGGARAPVAVEVSPPFSNLGDPPASASQIAEALDPLAALAAISLDGGDAPCARDVEVFDSRRRYTLAFRPAGREEVTTPAYSGPAHVCSVLYVPVAGFDAEDMAQPEVYAAPVTVWLADLPTGRTPIVRVAASVRQGPVTLPVGLRATIVSTEVSATRPR